MYPLLQETYDLQNGGRAKSGGGGSGSSDAGGGSSSGCGGRGAPRSFESDNGLPRIDENQSQVKIYYFTFSALNLICLCTSIVSFILLIITING